MNIAAKGLVVIALGLSFGSTAWAGVDAGTGINDTVHDMAASFPASPTDTLNRKCIYCHAPHNTMRLSPINGGPGAGTGDQAPDDFDYLPLWNHELTDNAGAYTMYQNGLGAPQTGDKASQAMLSTMTPGGSSLLCLSCHDGSVAVNSYGNASQPLDSQSGGGPTLNGTSYQIGKNGYLGNHHPIGFNYDDVQGADKEINDADTAELGEAGKVREHLLGSSNTQMECATCHSVHNTGNSGETLLWRSDEDSRLCLTCHAKGNDPGTTR